MGNLLRTHGGRVVAAGLGKAGAAADRTDVLFLDVDGNRLQTALIVSAGRAQQDGIDVGAGFLDAQLRLVADDHRTDIEGSGGILGDPLLVEVDKLLQALNAEVHVHLGDAEALVGDVQTLEVLLGPEQQDAAVVGTVGLHALKGLLRIVQDGGGGAQGDGAEGNDAGVMPALALVVLHEHHVVGEDGAEAELRALGGLFLGMFGFDDGETFHDSTLFSYFFVDFRSVLR